MLVVCAAFALAPAAPAAASDDTEVVAAQEVGLGSADTFWTEDWSTGHKNVPVLGVAQYAGEHALIYVDSRADLSPYIVDELGTAFDTVIYPTLTAAYGSEPNPGLDGDSRVVILIYDFNDPSSSVNASFDAADIDPGLAANSNPDEKSNGKEMFYINLQALRVDPSSGSDLAAHEFAHLIVHYQDVMLDPSGSGNPESTWLDEGFATYAEHLCGYDSTVDFQLRAFTRDPNFDLTYWQGVMANYGASYSFITYLADREGPDFVRALVRQPLDGTAGIDATLAAAGSADTFASLYDDWVLACFLDTHPPELQPYCFANLSVAGQPTALTGLAPVLGTATVVDYGAVYLDFPASASTAPFQAVLDGPTGAPLHAALISWDSSGAIPPSITPLNLANEAVGDTVEDRGGYDRHTLAVWARDGVGTQDSYTFTYTGVTDPPGGTQFLDLGGSDPAYQFVAVLLSRGVISGREVPAGSGLWFFMGKDKVSRAQFAKMIMLAIKKHTGDVDNPGNPTFSDVPYSFGFDTNGYPYDYVEEAATLGIVGGYGDGRFGPYDPITRTQLVLMIIRGAVAFGKPLSPYTGSAQVFADVPVSHPYYREIMTAYSAGILSGRVGSGGRLYFDPTASALRSHVAKMTANLVAHLETP